MRSGTHRKVSLSIKHLALLWFTFCLPGFVGVGPAAGAQADSPPPAFEGAKSSWHGFDRYDYLVDEKTLAVTPADGQTKGAVKAQRRCIVVVPKQAAAGRPWSWCGCYWDHEPQTEIEL